MKVQNNKWLLKFLTGSIQCSEENDESLLPGSLGTNNTSPAEHMDLFHVELAVVKKIEYLNFKTSNHEEMDFYSLEFKWKPPIVCLAIFWTKSSGRTLI